MSTRAAFFDLDKTVIAKASMAAFGSSFYKGGLLSRGAIIRSIYEHVIYLHLGASEKKLDKIRTSILKLTRGWEQDKVKAIVEEALADTISPILYTEALERIDWHQSQGDLVWLVSASPEEIVKPLGRFIGVDGVIASRAEVDPDGFYTGRMEFYCYGPNKAAAIQEISIQYEIDLSKSWAYSDSFTDLPMLEIVGNPVVVNPDRNLLKVAKTRNWEIRHFKSTTPLIAQESKQSLKTILATTVVLMMLLIIALVALLFGRSKIFASKSQSALPQALNNNKTNQT